MNIASVSAARPQDTPSQGNQKLRETAMQLEGLFARQLFSAMRATVHAEGVADGGAGEEMFTAMMDEHLADELPTKWRHGLTERMMAQLNGAPSNPTPVSQ